MKKMLKKMLAVLLSITMIIPMSLPTMTANAMSTREIDHSLITAGIACIPYAGYPLNTMLSSSIADWLGLTSLDDISDQLDEISDQINALSVQIQENQKQLLETLYANSLNQYYDLITDIKSQTRLYFNTLSMIEEDFDPTDTDVRDRMLETLLIADLGSTDLVDYTKDLSKASLYLSGGAVGMSENLLNLVYKAYCKDAALGGEAAYYASKTNGDIANCIQNAYFIASAMAYAQYYISENYDKYKELQQTDSDFEDYDITPYKSKVKTKARLNTINQDYGSIFGGLVEEKDSKENTTLYHCTPIEKGTPFTEGYVGDYNKMVSTNKFYYINDTDYSKAPVTVDYIKLSSGIGFYPLASYCEVQQDNSSNSSSNDSFDDFKEYTSKVETASNNRKNILSDDQLKNIFNHMKNNPAFGTDGEEDVSLMQALENFGFDFGAYEVYAKAHKTDDKDLQVMLTDAFSVFFNFTPIGPAMNESVNSANDNFSKEYHAFINTKEGVHNKDYDDLIPFFFKAQDETFINNEQEFVDVLNKAYNTEAPDENAIYVLNADLDLTGYNIPTYSTMNKFFQGTFDGNGHTIKNATIKGNMYGGLFSLTGKNTCIKNLNIENIKVSGTKMCGALIGGTSSSHETLIDNVNVISGTITSSETAGGLVGNVRSAIIVRNCTNNINVKSSGNVGGIAGLTNGNALFENNTNNGNITSTEEEAGGLVGFNLDGVIDFDASTNTGKITGGVGGGHAGQLCGFDKTRKKTINEDTVKDSVWATVFGEGNIVIIVSMAGLIVVAAVVIIVVQRKRKLSTIS